MPKSICEISLKPVLKAFERNCSIIGQHLNFPHDLKESVMRDRDALFRSFIKQYIRDSLMEANLRMIAIENINSITISRAQHSTISVQYTPISLLNSEYCVTLTAGKLLEASQIRSKIPYQIKSAEFREKGIKTNICDIMCDVELFFSRMELISMIYDEIDKVYGCGKLVAVHGMTDLYEGTTLDKNILITIYYVLGKAPDISGDIICEEEQISGLNLTFEFPEPYEESHIRALTHKHIFEKIEDMYKRGYIATSFARDEASERASNSYTVTFKKK